MNDSIRKTILLHLNTEDVEKNMQNLLFPCAFAGQMVKDDFAHTE